MFGKGEIDRARRVSVFCFYGVIAAQAITDLISAGIAVYLVRKLVWKKLDMKATI